MINIMNWLQKASGYEDTWELRLDGNLLLRGTEPECMHKLHQVQSGSADHAMKYEGYTISPSTKDWRDSYEFYGGSESTGDGQRWRCNECGFETFWSYDDLRTRGEPVCQRCDIDMSVRSF